MLTRHNLARWIYRKLLPVLLLCSLYNVPSHAADEPQKIGIEITTSLGDQQTFREHDLISFLLTLEHDAWIIAIYEDAEHHLLQLIPNNRQPNNFYQANIFIPIPPSDAAYTFRVQPPFGTETLWVFASDNADLNLNGKLLDNGLLLLDGNIDTIRNKIRSASAKWYGEADVSINTRAR